MKIVQMKVVWHERAHVPKNPPMSNFCPSHTPIHLEPKISNQITVSFESSTSSIVACFANNAAQLMLHIKGVQSAQAHQLSTINILLTNLLKFLKLGRNRNKANHSLSDLLFVPGTQWSYLLCATFRSTQYLLHVAHNKNHCLLHTVKTYSLSAINFYCASFCKICVTLRVVAGVMSWYNRIRPQPLCHLRGIGYQSTFRAQTTVPLSGLFFPWLPSTEECGSIEPRCRNPSFHVPVMTARTEPPPLPP